MLLQNTLLYTWSANNSKIRQQIIISTAFATSQEFKKLTNKKENIGVILAACSFLYFEQYTLAEREEKYLTDKSKNLMPKRKKKLKENVSVSRNFSFPCFVTEEGT